MRFMTLALMLTMLRAEAPTTTYPSVRAEALAQVKKTMAHKKAQHQKQVYAAVTVLFLLLPSLNKAVTNALATKGIKWAWDGVLGSLLLTGCLKELGESVIKSGKNDYQTNVYKKMKDKFLGYLSKKPSSAGYLDLALTPFKSDFKATEVEVIDTYALMAKRFHEWGILSSQQLLTIASNLKAISQWDKVLTTERFKITANVFLAVDHMLELSFYLAKEEGAVTTVFFTSPEVMTGYPSFADYTPHPLLIECLKTYRAGGTPSFKDEEGVLGLAS